MIKQRFVFLEHMADIKFKAFGISLAETFENAAVAFSKYVSANEKLKSNKKKTIKLKAADNEALLYSFLDELIYLVDAENFIVTSAKVKIEKNNLKASLLGANTKNLKLNHVKAATYAEMYIRKIKFGSEEAWEAQAVLDV
ncbi:MAG: archease [Nanoarchaeota archaeon]